MPTDEVRSKDSIQKPHDEFGTFVENGGRLRSTGSGANHTAGRWPKILEATAPFVYVRLHGDVELYTSGYTPAALDEWAGRIREWTGRGLDTYVYFDNDVKVRAPFDAMDLAARLRGR